MDFPSVFWNRFLSAAPRSWMFWRIPQSTDAHTHDQIVAIYSARDYAKPAQRCAQRLTVLITTCLFSGDLWLMARSALRTGR